MRHALTALIALIFGFAGAALYGWSGLSGRDTRAYIMAHPEVLPDAMDVLQSREMLARIEPLRGQLESPYPGAILGNPKGAVTLVEFSDYACGFCRQSLKDVDALIAANPDLRVVMRELPILTPESADAARMALAAAQQGRYRQFHDAMFAQGQVTTETITAAAKEAGIDLAKARTAVESGAFEAQLQNNAMLAQQLGITGTPSWIVGDTALNGAVGMHAIGEAIKAAREG